jgi:hypothetical protein
MVTAEIQVLALAAKNDAALVRWAESDYDSPCRGQQGISPYVAAMMWLRVYPERLGHGYKSWALGADERARALRDAHPVTTEA